MLAAEVVVGGEAHAGFEVVVGVFDGAAVVAVGWSRVRFVVFEIDGHGSDVAGSQGDANARAEGWLQLAGVRGTRASSTRVRTLRRMPWSSRRALEATRA